MTFRANDVPFVESGEKWGIFPTENSTGLVCVVIAFTSMGSFKGQAQYSVDNKGRVAIPAKMRSVLRPEAVGTFTMTRGFEPCIYLYAHDEWLKKEEQYASLNQYDRKARHMVRTILMWADDVTLDAQGRIGLSKPLMEYAEVSEQALIIGAMDRIEIWDPTVFQKYLGDQPDDH